MVKEAYGITDLSLLACDPWSGERLRCFISLRMIARSFCIACVCTS